MTRQRNFFSDTVIYQQKKSIHFFSATPVFAEEVIFNFRTNTFKYGKSDRGGGRYV